MLMKFSIATILTMGPGGGGPEMAHFVPRGGSVSRRGVQLWPNSPGLLVPGKLQMGSSGPRWWPPSVRHLQVWALSLLLPAALSIC